MTTTSNRITEVDVFETKTFEPDRKTERKRKRERNLIVIHIEILSNSEWHEF